MHPNAVQLVKAVSEAVMRRSAAQFVQVSLAEWLQVATPPGELPSEG
jgi:hypothetical protein